MKKVSKILTVALVIILVLGIFAGCSLFGKDAAKYRAAEAFTVGNEKISIGKLLDTYNNMYYTYQQYISAGYMTLDDLFNNVMESLYSQFMKIDDYKTSDGVKKYTLTENKYINDFTNADYVSQAEIEFAVSNVKYSIYGVFDNYIEQYIAVDYKLADAETEDTSRKFTEIDDMAGFPTYADKVYNDKLINKDADKYFKDYYPGLDTSAATYSDYVYTSETDAGVLKKVENFNKRIAKYIEENDEKQDSYPTITAAQYIEWQKKAVSKYEKSIDITYGADLASFFKDQVVEVINTIIAYKYDLKVSKQVEASLQTLKDNLTANYESAVNAAKTDFNINPDKFVAFIEALAATSYIYNVPSAYADKYVFVKNILIPFNDSQKAELSNYENAVKDTESQEYKDFREKLAAKIEARDFLLDEDADKVTGLFEVVDGKISVKADGALGQYFGANGRVTAMEKDGSTLSLDETVIELMKQYNTDTAQHSATYDYVVRVGDTPSNYTAKWVKEFVAAANDAYTKGVGSYGICVSAYGVHIVYYVKPVTAEIMDFNGDNLYNPAKPEYRFLKTYFNDQLKIYTEKATEELDKKYKEGSLIKINSEFKKFLKDNGITYDFDEAMKIDDEES